MQTVTELAQRISLISESSTMKVAAEADRLRREGVDVVDFSAGEPDFPTPDNIKRAAIRALDENFNNYTPVSGVVELKKAICDHHRNLYGTSYGLEMVDPASNSVFALRPEWAFALDSADFAGSPTSFTFAPMGSTTSMKFTS